MAMPVEKAVRRMILWYTAAQSPPIHLFGQEQLNLELAQVVVSSLRPAPWHQSDQSDHPRHRTSLTGRCGRLDRLGLEWPNCAWRWCLPCKLIWWHTIFYLCCRRRCYRSIRSKIFSRISLIYRFTLIVLIHTITKVKQYVLCNLL